MKETHDIRAPGVDITGHGDVETAEEQDGGFVVEDYEAGDDSYEIEATMDIEIGDEYVIEVNYDGGRVNRHMKRRRNASGEERRKRRRKCGQCGPCQVKVDCGHCKYCERKDVLKQSCIYKKCVYLRKGEACLTSPKRRASGREKGSPARKELVTMVNRSVRYTDIFLAEEENDHQDYLEPESADILPVTDASDNNESFELPEVGEFNMPVDRQETMQEEVTMDPLPTIEEQSEIQDGPQGLDRATEPPQDNVSTFQSPRSDLAAQISKDLRECAKKSFSPDAIAQRRMTLEKALNVPQSDNNLGYSVFNISSTRNGRQITPNRELSSSSTHDVPSPPSSIRTGRGYAISHPISHHASFTPSDPLLPPACPAISSLSPVDDVQMPALSPFNETAGVVRIKQEPPFIQNPSETSTSSATEIASDVTGKANVNGADKENGVNLGLKISSAFSLQRSPLPAFHADQYPIFVKSQSPPSSCHNQTGSTVHHTSSVPHQSLHATEQQSTDMNPHKLKRYFTKRMLRDPNHNLCSPHELNAEMAKNIFTDPFDNSYNGVDAYGDHPRTNGQEKHTESDAQNSIDKEPSSRENVGPTSAQNKPNQNLHNTKEASVHVCNPFQESFLRDNMNNHPLSSDFYARSRLFPRESFVQKRNLKRPNTDNPRRKYKKRVSKNRQPDDTLHPPSQKETLESQPWRLSNKMDATNLSHNRFHGPYSMMNRPMYAPSQATSGNGLPYDPPWNPAMRPPFPGADFFKYHPNFPPPHPGLLPHHMTPAHASVPSMLPPALIPPTSRGMISPSQMPPTSSQITCHRPPSPRMMPPHPFMQPHLPHMAPPAHVPFSRHLSPYLPMGYPYPPPINFPPGLAAMMPPNANNMPPTQGTGGYPLPLTGPPFVQNPINEVPYPEIKKQLNDMDAMRDNYVKEASGMLPEGRNFDKIHDSLIATELPDRPSHRHIMSPERFMTSPDMACDVITIDDFMVNAYIRGDGANSIEIQMDSVSLLDDSLSAKSRTSEACPQRGSEKVQLGGTLMLKQDLGEEGVIQMEIPGHAVSVEVSELDYRLTELSSNRTELLAFIANGAQNNCT